MLLGMNREGFCKTGSDPRRFRVRFLHEGVYDGALHELAAHGFTVL